MFLLLLNADFGGVDTSHHQFCCDSNKTIRWIIQIEFDSCAAEGVTTGVLCMYVVGRKVRKWNRISEVSGLKMAKENYKKMSDATYFE